MMTLKLAMASHTFFTRTTEAKGILFRRTIAGVTLTKTSNAASDPPHRENKSVVVFDFEGSPWSLLDRCSPTDRGECEAGRPAENASVY